MSFPRLVGLEEILAERDIAFRYEEAAPLDSFLFNKSKQARLDHHRLRTLSVNLDVVSRFAEDMRLGEVFPAILAEEQRGGLFIVDGLIRYAAALEAGLTSFPTYIMVPGEAEATLVDETAAASHSGGQTDYDANPERQDRVAQAGLSPTARRPHHQHGAF